jgi:hypothetical protein
MNDPLLSSSPWHERRYVTTINKRGNECAKVRVEVRSDRTALPLLSRERRYPTNRCLGPGQAVKLSENDTICASTDHLAARLYTVEEVRCVHEVDGVSLSH